MITSYGYGLDDLNLDKKPVTKTESNKESSVPELKQKKRNTKKSKKND